MYQMNTKKADVAIFSQSRRSQEHYPKVTSFYPFLMIKVSTYQEDRILLYAPNNSFKIYKAKIARIGKIGKSPFIQGEFNKLLLVTSQSKTKKRINL